MSNITPPSPERRTIFTKARFVRLVISLILGLLLAGGLAAYQIHQDESRRQDLATIASDPSPITKPSSIGGAFTLQSMNGETVTDAQYRGKYMLVYFGYTFCPDMCPTGLQSMSGAMDKLGAEAIKIQPLFITIDPARDTAAKLKEYTASFHPSIIGLTGTPEQIAAVAKAYQVYYAKSEDVGDGEYMMDHSTVIYLMSPDGQFITTFPQDVNPTAIATKIREDMTSRKPKTP